MEEMPRPLSPRPTPTGREGRQGRALGKSTTAKGGEDGGRLES